MPIIHDKKIVFIHIPRTGGTSVNDYFLSKGFFQDHKLDTSTYNFHILYGLYRFNNQIFELDHLTFKEIERFSAPIVHKNYKKFAVVRDPIQRILSEYKRIKKQRDFRLFDCSNMTFESFLTKIEEIFDNEFQGVGHFRRSHIIPQHEYVDGAEDVTILYFERLADEWRKFSEENKLPDFYLPHKNQAKTNGGDDISEGSVKIIRKLYSKDFDAFGYD